jgi:hypothetical protein
VYVAAPRAVGPPPPRRGARAWHWQSTRADVMVMTRQPAALGCVCGIALSWVASTQLSKTLISGEANGANLFLVWFSTNFNVMLVRASLNVRLACGARVP